MDNEKQFTIRFQLIVFTYQFSLIHCMKYFLIITALILAAISLGIIILFVLLYSAWINGDVDNVVLPGVGLLISTPFILTVMAVSEFLISLILYFIVRRLRK